MRNRKLNWATLFFSIEVDAVEAVNWWRKAALQNHALGQFHLGQACLFGLGVKADNVEGAIWLRRAAEQNLAEAECGLGCCYFPGAGSQQR
jgi:TPR repeat protein